MNRILRLRDANFNASQFRFEKEETEAVFSHAALRSKMERRHRMKKMQSELLLT